MTRGRPSSARGVTLSGASLGLVVGAAFAFTGGMTRPAGVPVALMLLVALGISLRWRAGPIVLVAIAVAGVVLRLEAYQVGTSDVLTVTVAAIERVLDGGNPYGVGYAETNPPGAPFPYGPLSLLWYLPFRDDPRQFEFFISLLTLGLLTLRGRPVGASLYATFPPLLTLASDGSNDTSAGLLLLAALVAVGRVGPWGGALLAVAAAFKPLAFAWLPPLLAAGTAAQLAGFAVMTALTWGSAALVWGPGQIWASIVLADAVHTAPYYSLAAAVEQLTGGPVPAELFARLRLALGAAAATITMLLARGPSALIVGGSLVYLVTLYTGYWSTFAYLAAIAPVVCWYLDGWIGCRDHIRWPGDPAGAITGWTDAVWPVRAGGA